MVEIAILAYLQYLIDMREMVESKFLLNAFQAVLKKFQRERRE